MLGSRLFVDHALWFFSTCAQTFSALVGVFGMFVVYRLQIEEGRIGNLRERMICFKEEHAKLPFDTILQELKRMQEDHYRRAEHEHSENIRTLLEDYAGAMAKRRWLAKSARRPIFLLIFLILFSLFCLLIYPFYAGSYHWTSDFLWVTFLLSILPLYDVGAVISVSIRTD